MSIITPLSGLTYGSRFIDNYIGVSGETPIYSSCIYTGFFGGGSLQSQELNEIQDQNQFQLSKYNEFIGNWLKINVTNFEPDPIDSPIYTSTIDNEITYENPDIKLNTQISVPEGYYLYNLMYFLRLKPFAMFDDSNIVNFIKNNIITEIANPSVSPEWKNILRDNFNTNNLYSIGSNRIIYRFGTKNILCYSYFHPNISQYTRSKDSTQIELQVKKSSVDSCEQSITVTIVGSSDWIGFENGVSSLSFDDGDFVEGTISFNVYLSENTTYQGRTASIQLSPTNTKTQWPTGILNNITIIQSQSPSPAPIVVDIPNQITINNDSESFDIDISASSNTIPTNIQVTTDVNWITCPTNIQSFNNNTTVGFTCEKNLTYNNRSANLIFNFLQNGFPVSQKSVQVIQSSVSYSSLPSFIMPRLVDLDIYGYSATKTNFDASIDQYPNLNLPYVFYQEGQWDYGNAGSIDNYRYGTAYHKVSIQPQQSSLIFQAGSLGRFSDWSYWSLNAGSTYIRVKIDGTTDTSEFAVGDILLQYATNISDGDLLPDAKRALFKSEIMSIDENSMTLKTLPIYDGLVGESDNFNAIFTSNIIKYYNQIGQLKNLDITRNLYKNTSTFINLDDTTVTYELDERQLRLEDQNKQPGPQLIGELHHRSAFMPTEQTVNANDYMISPFDLGDHARKSPTGQQVIRSPQYRYQFYDWTRGIVIGTNHQNMQSGFNGNLFINSNGHLRIPLGGYVQDTSPTFRWYEFFRIALIAGNKQDALLSIKNKLSDFLEYRIEGSNPTGITGAVQWERDEQDNIINFKPLNLIFDDVGLVTGDQTNDQFALFLDQTGKIHGLFDRSPNITEGSIEAIWYLDPSWFQQSGVLIDENGPVNNPPQDGFIKVVTAGGHNVKKFKDLMIGWILHKSGKLYGVDIGSSITVRHEEEGAVTQTANILNPSNENFYKSIRPDYHLGIPGLGINNQATFRNPNIVSSIIGWYFPSQPIPPDQDPNFVDIKKYIKYCLNLIPKINGTRLPVLNIIGGYRNHSGMFMCGLPADPSHPITDTGLNQKIQFVFPNLEISNYNIDLYERLKRWNSNCDENGTWTYVPNPKFDSDLYDKLFRVKVNNQFYYVPPRCYGLNTYSVRFWILSNNGILAST